MNVSVRVNDKQKIKELEESLDRIHPIAEWKREEVVIDKRKYWRYEHD